MRNAYGISLGTSLERHLQPAFLGALTFKLDPKSSSLCLDCWPYLANDKDEQVEKLIRDEVSASIVRDATDGTTADDMKDEIDKALLLLERPLCLENLRARWESAHSIQRRRCVVPFSEIRCTCFTI